MMKFKLSALIFVFFLTTITVSAGMNLLQNEFQKQWNSLSNDVDRLNQYTKAHAVELRKIKVGEKDLDGVNFSKATFVGVDWEGTLLHKSNFAKTVFKDCKFLGSLHGGSTFNDVIFENCTFHSVEFAGSVFINVRFKNCKITDSRLEDASGNELLFEDSVLEERTSLAGSRTPMTFRRCKLDGVYLSGMEIPNKMIVEDSFLSEVDFGRGHFSEVVLRRVRQGEAPVRFNESTGRSFRFEEVEMNRGVSLAGVKAESASINRSQIRVTFRGADIKKITVRDSQTVNFSVRKSNLPHVEIVNSYIFDPMICEGHLGELLIQDSTLEQADFDSITVGYMVFHNVTMKGKVDFSNAAVKSFKAQGVKRDPSLQLITTGSNIKFQ